jgi:hypothetical protein
VFLIRDPLIVAELHLSAAQKSALAELAVTANESAWKLRDLVPEAGIGSDEVPKLNASLEASLDERLNPAQHDRLNQISLRIQGPAALTQSKVAERLALSSSQRGGIARLAAQTQRAFQALRKEASAGRKLPELSRQVEQLRAKLQSDLLATLTDEQRDRWNALQGDSFDISKLQPLSAQAPELRGIQAWINTEPLTLNKLRGQVVALHFWTFG